MSILAVQAQGTTLHIAGSSGSAEPCTAISVGRETTIAITGHAGVANGDVVTFAAFTGADAATINGVSAVVKGYKTGVTNDYFVVDIDTYGKTITLGSGTATPAAWTKVGQLTDIKGTSDTSPDIEVTDLDSTTKEYLPGLPDTGNVTMSVFCVDSDTGLAAIEAAFDARIAKSFKITYPTGSTPIRTFTAFVKSFPKVGDASKDGVVTGSVELKRSGSVVKS
jgi:hypothetical protein